jgi:NAD(P)-dependent dehydrogenase (short-subunit alcohol dehydrogenase family)
VSPYVVTGGTDAFADALSAYLRRPVLREPIGTIEAWIHLVPGDGSKDETASLSAAVAAADQMLPRGEGAAFIAVVPVFGVIEPPLDEVAELAAGAARSFARARIERWSDEGRWFNVIVYGALDTDAVPGLRPRDVLAARTPMHRLAGLSELADAVDFLASSSASYVTGSVLDLDGGWAAYSWFYPARDL